MIVPYKNRMWDLDPKVPVEVYRNINKPGVWYTIRQNGYVVAHTDELKLINAEFHVSEAGRRRVLETGRKNVHAWIRGEIVTAQGDCTSDNMFQVIYNPKRYKTFRRPDTRKPVKKAVFVAISKYGVFADNTVNL
jgi:hypothetical protein